MMRIVQTALAVAIVAFWLHSMHGALHLEQEATPRDVRVGRASYEVLLARALDRDPVQYLGIYQGNTPVGYSYTEVRRLSRSQFFIENETYVAPDLIIPLPARVQSQVRIGPDFMVEHFTAELQMSAGFSRVRLPFEGEAAGNEMVIQVPSFGGGTPQTVRVAREMTLFNGLSPFVGIPQLRVGEEWYIQGIDLAGLAGGFKAENFRLKVLTAKVTGEETLEWEGRPVRTFVASIAEEPNDPLRRRTKAWIAEDGRVLREEHRVLDWTFRFQREPVPERRRGWRRTR
jgi:hypothetical protein